MERSVTVGTVNGQERLETFEPERSNALERIVKKVNGTVTVRSRLRFKNEIITVLFFKTVFLRSIRSISTMTKCRSRHNAGPGTDYQKTIQ